MNKWTRAMYQPNRPLEEGRYVTASPEHMNLSREAAAEGMVLLKNDHGTLPLKAGCGVAVAGRGSFDIVKGGGGSGDVYTMRLVTVPEGLRENGLQVFAPLEAYYREDVKRQYAGGAVPGMTVEPPVPEDLLDQAAAWTDTAVVILSRFSGEGWDRLQVPFDDPDVVHPWGRSEGPGEIAQRIYPEGDFCLTEGERALIGAVCRRFPKVIAVLNTGGVMETSWIKDSDAVGAALLMWQGGTLGGQAAADILCGKVNPSGKLPDTFACRLEDYPSTAGFHKSARYVEYTEDIYVGYRYFETIPGAAEKVVYPFGYGLSYTTFESKLTSASEKGGKLYFDVLVTNTGNTAGKEAAAVYVSAPQGVLGHPARELCAFAKTGLLQPGESEQLQLIADLAWMASFDDLGKIEKSAMLLEKGEYRFYLGSCVRTAALTDFVWTLQENLILQRLSGYLKPVSLKKRMLADGTFEALETGEEPDIDRCIFEKMAPGSEEGLLPEIQGRGHRMARDVIPKGRAPLSEVAEGRLPEEDFLRQLSDDELIRLLGGCENTGVANTWGFGGLPEAGIPGVMTADGPAGVRINPECGIRTTAWPCATLLAATFNTALIGEVGHLAGRELKENNLQVWLAPGMNIHRNPLCGRNFEYFSEDPLLSGKMAASEVRGIQSNGVSACIKHFACNNKETNRKHSDSRVSQRALREIYLRGFEIAVKEGRPWALMSAYNAVNGQRCSESRDLLTGILRGEWGYDGLVTTDWWNRAEHYKEILAGNDVKMACGFPERVKKAMEMGALVREDLEACARRVIHLICRLD